jgi:arylsulfatase
MREWSSPIITPSRVAQRARAAFIMGQSVFCLGLSKVGLPGAAADMQAEDPTIAELLKPHGYVTGQFGKKSLR